MSPLQLHFSACSVELARALNMLWHSRLPILRQTMAKVCYCAVYNNIYFATALWFSPSSFNVDQSWLELKRFAISPNSPKNTASRMLSWMVKDVKKRFLDVSTLISYQDPSVHFGTIYKASNWTFTGIRNSSGFGGSKTRFRRADQAPGPKGRWEMRITSKRKQASKKFKADVTQIRSKKIMIPIKTGQSLIKFRRGSKVLFRVSGTAYEGGEVLTCDGGMLLICDYKAVTTKKHDSEVEVAEILYENYQSKAYMQDGYDTFRQYCESKFGMKYRKAMYFVALWRKVKLLDLNPQRIMTIGWSKMIVLEKVLTKQNSLYWMDAAEQTNLRGLAEIVSSKAQEVDYEIG